LININTGSAVQGQVPSDSRGVIVQVRCKIMYTECQTKHWNPREVVISLGMNQLPMSKYFGSVGKWYSTFNCHKNIETLMIQSLQTRKHDWLAFPETKMGKTRLLFWWIVFASIWNNIL